MLGWFKQKSQVNEVEIVAPLSGKAVPLEQVPDEAFAQKFMGDGIAIEPSDGLLVAPFDGTIAHLIDTHHAVIVEHESGLQMLLHIGINTVSLKGQGFEVKIANGDKVKAGQPLIQCDLEAVKAAGYSVVTPVVIANQEAVESFQLGEHELTRGQSLLMKVKMSS